MNRMIWCAALPIVALLGGCAGSGTTQTTPQSQSDTKVASSSKGGSSPAQQDPLYSLTLMRQGSVLLQQEQYGEALKKFEQANVVAPGNATVYNMIGLCHLRMGSYDEALSSFNTALDLVPSYTDARNNRGATYLALGQLRLAEVDFLAVLGDSTYPHRYRVYFNLGTTYYQQGHLGAAEENFRKAVTAPFPVYEAYVQLATVWLEQGRDQEAVELLEEARLKFPERTDASFQLGKTLMGLGRTEEARPYLEDVISKEPGSERAQQAAKLLDAV